MRKLSGIITCITLLLLSSCITIPVVTLDSVKTDDNELNINRGSVTQIIANTDRIAAMSSTSLDGKEAGIIVGIGNSTETKQTFYDSDIEIFGGNIDTGKWKSIGTWDANKYYNNAKNAAATSEFWTAFGGSMMTASAAMGSTSTSRVNTQNGSYTISTKTYDPAKTALTGMVAADLVNSEITANKANMNWLKDSLLYSSEILPMNVYTGMLFFEASKYPDYLIRINGSENNMDFYFQRSDRDSIINPWSDQSRIRHSIALNYGFHDHSIGLLYFMSQTKGVGVYTGLSYADLTHPSLYGINSAEKFSYSPVQFNQNINDYICKKHNLTDKYDIQSQQFTSTGNILFNSLNLPIGMTIKVFPNSWLLLGAELRFGLDKYESGILSYSIRGSSETFEYPEEIYLSYTSTNDRPMSIAAELGFNFITNMIDIHVIASYDMRYNKFGCNIGLGYAF